MSRSSSPELGEDLASTDPFSTVPIPVFDQAFTTNTYAYNASPVLRDNILDVFPDGTEFQPYELDYVRDFESLNALAIAIQLNAAFQFLDRDVWHIMNGFNEERPFSIE